MIERLGGLFRRKFVRDTLTLQIGKVGVLLVTVAASVVVPRLLGPTDYGTWQLIVSLYGMWQVLNLTGQGPTAQTRLAAAVGAKDSAQVLSVLAFYVQITLLYCALSSLLLLAFSYSPVVGWLYDGDRTIVLLAVLLSLTQPTELIYQLLVTTFSSRRQMRHVALLQNANQLVLMGTTVIAVIIWRTPAAVVLSRLVYSPLTLLMVFVLYQRTRLNPTLDYPGLGTVFRAAFSGWHLRAHWRFGLANALDKNVARLFTTVPVQMVGAVAGREAAGFLGLAMSALNQGAFFMSSVLENLQAVVPQSVGRGDYVRLRQNLGRVILALAVGSGAFYVVFALAAPIAVPILYGVEWLPAVPLIQVMGIYGVAVALGGLFAPLYRVFEQVRTAFLIKLAILLVMVPVGYGLVRAYGALGGVWMLNLLMIGSGILMGLLTLPELRARARSQAASEFPRQSSL